jgi:2-amino-4-hydroxy-6-hydroxymethyldihydropteridine diphosphokinase
MMQRNLSIRTFYDAGIVQRMIKEAGGIICFIGLGANLGQPVQQCLEAIERLHNTEGVHFLRRSSFYRTEPVGDGLQEWFINGVAEFRTFFDAGKLLQTLLDIERLMGRVRRTPGGEPRVIDLDLLLYGQEVLEAPGMVVPHPELYKRRFVLVPMHEIAPYVIHPAFGISIRGLLDRLDDSHRVELI